MSAGAAAGLAALIFFSSFGSSAAQLPSKAATSSPDLACGQPSRFQLAPLALVVALAAWVVIPMEQRQVLAELV
jgi:hypothetical protein